MRKINSVFYFFMVLVIYSQEAMSIGFNIYFNGELVAKYDSDYGAYCYKVEWFDKDEIHSFIPDVISKVLELNKFSDFHRFANSVGTRLPSTITIPHASLENSYIFYSGSATVLSNTHMAGSVSKIEFNIFIQNDDQNYSVTGTLSMKPDDDFYQCKPAND